MTFPPMRPQVEIQHKHDMLMGLMSDTRLRDAVVPREYQSALAMAADVLCWILHHDVDSHPDAHAAEFAQILRDVETGLKDVGCTWDWPDGAEYVVEE